jgi:hypothetical protein
MIFTPCFLSQQWHLRVGMYLCLIWCAAIRVACKWYQQHLARALNVKNISQTSPLAPTILLISNDAENVAKALAEGINAVTSECQVLCHILL